MITAHAVYRRCVRLGGDIVEQGVGTRGRGRAAPALRRLRAMLAVALILHWPGAFAHCPAATASANIVASICSAGGHGRGAALPDSHGKQDRVITNVPQSVVVIPRQLIQEEGLRDRADALRNVAAVIPNVPLNFDGSGASDRVRGFQPEFYRDGLISFFDAGDRDSLVGVDRYEVIKGPTGSLFGSGIGGGLFFDRVISVAYTNGD